MKRLGSSAGLVLSAALTQFPQVAHAQVTPGYPERVLQWTVLPGESCEDVAIALYGSKNHMVLLERYNNVQCARGGDLPDAMTLVVPEMVTEVAPAKLEALAPDVREKPPGGTWVSANPGMPLYRNHSVNTLEHARADIRFVDRSRIVMAAHTLVIIYGRAKDSAQTQKSATVELEEGELQAGLMALRGRSPTVAVKGGGEVTANSRDTAIRSKPERNRVNRTTVSVFDGSARVRSGGATVDVPEKFGTSFVAAQPPARPRPLPPAPRWAPESDDGVMIGGESGTVVATSWQAIGNAASYRVELASDPSFHDLLAREEVPSSITAFRAERLQSGTYYLRVRAVDNEDFLGLASPTRKICVVSLAVDGAAGNVGSGVLEVSPYARLGVKADDGLELAIDNGVYGPVPSTIDLMKRPVARLSWRQRGTDKVASYRLEYLPIAARATLEGAASSRRVRVSFDNISESDLIERVKPRLRLQYVTGASELALSHQPGQRQWFAVLPSQASQLSYLDVVDARGKTLTTLSVAAVVPAAPHPPAMQESFEVGPCLPLVPSSSDVSMALWAPTACNNASVTISTDNANAVWAERASLRASAMVRSVGFEATVQSGLSTTTRRGDDALWFGARWRALELGRRWTMGPALRLMLPPTADSMPLRVETGWALAGQFRRLSVLGDLGARVATSREQRSGAAPSEQLFLIGGLAHDLTRRFRGFAQLDSQLIYRDGQPLYGRMGLGLAVETRGSIYSGWALRFSPWRDSGTLAVQLAVGLRQ